MADGSYRFHQPGTGQYYQQHNQQVYHQRHLARNGSPVNGSRANYNNDTPSPSRSPVSQGPSNIPFSMFNQTHQQGQHGMMNGGSSHQRYMQMNLPHKYQHQPHQQHHGQQTHHQLQNHGGHPGPGQNGAGHQHSFSSGVLSNSTPSYNSNGVPTGSQADEQGDLGEHFSEHWHEQLQMAADLRQTATASHRHTKRAGAVTTKGTLQSVTTESQKEGESEERNRALPFLEDLRQDWDGLDLSGQGLRALSLCLFDNYTFLTKLYIDNNKISVLPSGISQLRNLEFLQASNNQLRELPESIGMLVKLKQLLVFDNLIQTLPCQIGHLHRLEMLGIEGNPIEDELKDIIIQEGTQALVMHVRDKTQASTPPRPREKVIVDDSDAAEKITVLDWNILCDKYATAAQYGYTPTKALSWEYRRDLILAELRALDADIVSLQEVDTECFDWLRRELALQHYKGMFWPRARARTMADKDARLVDGCATFYKGQKFILLEKQLVDFANTAINRPDMKGEHDIFNRVMPRDHIAVVSFFENRMTGSRLIVANAHIFWDPTYEDVKLVQVAILMEALAKFADRWSSFPPCTDKTAFRYTEQDEETRSETVETPRAEPLPSLEYTEGAQIPLIVCGDFNCSKGSGIHDLIDHGAISHDHPDLGDRSYGHFTRDGMSHPFNLRSAYEGENSDGENIIDFTNYTPGFSGCIDYIWHTPHNLRVKQLLGSVDDDYLQTVPGFPNFHFPSDHLPLFAEFSVEPRKERLKVVEADFGPQRERRN